MHRNQLKKSKLDLRINNSSNIFKKKSDELDTLPSTSQVEAVLEQNEVEGKDNINQNRIVPQRKKRKRSRSDNVEVRRSERLKKQKM